MSKVGYLAKVGLIYFLTLVDLVINGVADHHQLSMHEAPFIWIGVQFAVQLFNFLLIFLLFFGTYLFQVGLIGEVVREFRPVLFSMLGYACIFAAYAGCKLSLYLGSDTTPSMNEDELWTMTSFRTLSVIQKIAALGYYVIMLHTTLRLGEAKWYQKGPWVQKYSNLTPGGGA